MRVLSRSLLGAAPSICAGFYKKPKRRKPPTLATRKGPRSGHDAPARIAGVLRDLYCHERAGRRSRASDPGKDIGGSMRRKILFKVISVLDRWMRKHNCCIIPFTKGDAFVRDDQLKHRYQIGRAHV